MRYDNYKTQILTWSIKGFTSDQMAEKLSEKYKDINLKNGSGIRTALRRWRSEKAVKKQTNNTANVLVWDIETSPLLVWNWSLRQKYTQIEAIKQKSFMICYSAKWLFEDEVMEGSVTSEEALNQDDERIVRKVWDLLDKADILVGYNSASFDEKKVNARFLKYGLAQPSPYETLDIYKDVKKKFNLESKKLDYMAEYLGIEGKSNTSFQLWLDCMKGDEKQLKYMQKYCITPDHKLLTEGMNWVEAGNIKVGDVVLGFDENPCDNTGNRKYKPAKVEKVTFDNAPVYAVELTNGDIIKTTAEHRWLSRSGSGSLRWKRTDELVPTNEACTNQNGDVLPKVLKNRTAKNEKDMAYLAGILDGEGTCSGAYNAITFAQNKGPVLDKCKRILESESIDYGERTMKSGCSKITINGGHKARVSIMAMTDTVRLSEKFNFNEMGRVECTYQTPQIKSINLIGNREIVKIQTSTGTFVCDGYLMHNCSQDVKVLENVYLLMLPYIKHTNMGLFLDDDKEVCPSCGSNDLKEDGVYQTAVNTYQSYRCNNCNSLSRGRKNITKNTKSLKSL